MVRYMGTEKATEILSIVRALSYWFDPIAKCCRISRLPSRNERRVLLEAVANVVFKQW